MLRKTFAFFVIATGMAAAPIMAQTPEDSAKAVACAQSLGLVKSEVDTVVVSLRGPDSVALATFDPTGGATPEKDVHATAFDINTCQLVELDFWVQDPQATASDQVKGTSARFSSNLFGNGVREVRASRAMDRDLGFVVGFVD